MGRESHAHGTKMYFDSSRASDLIVNRMWQFLYFKDALG